MQQNNSGKWNFLSNKKLFWGTIIVILFLFLLSAWLFFWNRERHFFNDNYVLDNALWGTLGDFVGGFIGSILAFIGVIVTCQIFIEQRQQTIDLNEEQKRITSNSQKSQINQSEIQRFNSLFFELIDLHRTQVDYLMKMPLVGFEAENSKETNFFDRFMEELHSNSNVNSSYARAFIVAKRKYLQLYLSNSTILAPYFRVLYRLFELIDKANIEEKEKVRYAKIARAQLSESELFILRYNSANLYGDNFIEYINKFRLLKHLPLLSLLEFKNIRNVIAEGDSLYQYSINMLFFSVWKRIYNITVGHEDRTNDFVQLYDERKRYKFELKMPKKHRTALYLTIDTSRPNRDPLLKCFRNFNESDFGKLLTNFLLEIYKYSNFSRYNKDENIEYHKKVFHDGSVTKIVCWILNTENKLLRVSHPSRDKFYGISED